MTKKTALHILILLVLATTTSCTRRSNINDRFESQYAGQVKQIQDYRNKEEALRYPKPQKQSWLGRLFGRKPQALPPRNYTPDASTYGAAMAIPPAFPPDIFEIKYNLAQYPPFVKIGDDFDQIEIPKYDAFGVASTFDGKEYFLIGNDNLQRNIDKINASQNDEDKEFSDVLISENKTLRRQQKYNAIFKDDELAKEVQEKKLSEEEQAEIEFLAEKKAKRNDPFTKMIGAQIVEQNLRANGMVQQQQGGNINKK